MPYGGFSLGTLMSEVHRFVPVICRLSRASLDDLVEIEAQSNTPPWTKKLFDYEFDNEVGRIWGARLGGDLVGFLVAHFVLDEVHILNFGVRRSLRGQGIGRALISHVLRETFDESARWSTLEVRKSNRAARALYESLGFSEIAIREKYYSDDLEDAVVMGLNLQHFISQHEEGQTTTVRT